IQVVVVAAVLEGLVSGIGRLPRLERETRAPALLKNRVPIEAEAEAGAAPVIRDRGILRRLRLELLAETDVARELEFGHRGTEVEFSSGRIGREVTHQFGAQVLRFLIADEALADQKVEQRPAVLRRGVGASGNHHSGTEGRASNKGKVHWSWSAAGRLLPPTAP